MYNKVQICGIDTSEIPVLAEVDCNSLLISAKEGNTASRDKLIKCNLRLVLSVVKRFSSRGENPDDLFQIGCIGLIKAIDNFDISQNVKFSTYAVPMIIGEIRRFLRDNGIMRVSRSIKDTAYHAMQAKEALTRKLGREPYVSEIADSLNIDKSDIVIALESVVEPVSLYEPVFSDSGDTMYILDQIGDKNDGNSFIDEICIRESIKNLTKKEKEILFLRFYSGLTQVEVSDKIGISQAQVSRLEKGAMNKIKC